MFLKILNNSLTLEEHKIMNEIFKKTEKRFEFIGNSSIKVDFEETILANKELLLTPKPVPGTTLTVYPLFYYLEFYIGNRLVTIETINGVLIEILDLLKNEFLQTKKLSAEALKVAYMLDAGIEGPICVSTHLKDISLINEGFGRHKEMILERLLDSIHVFSEQKQELLQNLYAYQYKTAYQRSLIKSQEVQELLVTLNPQDRKGFELDLNRLLEKWGPTLFKDKFKR